MYKKIIIYILSISLVCMLCACRLNDGEKANSDNANEYVKENMSPVQIVNPWSYNLTIEEAEEKVGFNFDTIKSVEINSISIMIGMEYNLIQGIFFDGDNEIIIRKGNTEGNISGDYNIYKQEEVINMNNVCVTLKGNEGLYSLAEWTVNGYSYSISCNQGVEYNTILSYLDVLIEDN